MFYNKKKKLIASVVICLHFVNLISSVSFASIDNEQSLLCSVDKIDDEDKVKNQDFNLENNDDITLEVNNSSKDNILSKEKIDGIKNLAEKLDMPFKILLEKLRLNLNSCKSYLVPLIETEEHKNCLLDIFCYANPEYMKYYLDGKLKPLEKVERIFYVNSLKRMWQGKIPKSLNFIIDVNNSVGRIAVGPLYDRGTIDSEIGYAIKEGYSRKGITSEAVKTLIELLRYLIKSGKYDIEKIRATAKEGNIASNKILQRNGFIKMPEMLYDGYSPENEYFYYFK